VEIKAVGYRDLQRVNSDANNLCIAWRICKGINNDTPFTLGQKSAFLDFIQIICNEKMSRYNLVNNKFFDASLL
jgi:hypothetical protein